MRTSCEHGTCQTRNLLTDVAGQGPADVLALVTARAARGSMFSLSNESTPRERLARFISLAKRGRAYLWTALVIFTIGSAISLAIAVRTKRIFRSETSVLYRDGIQTPMTDAESAAQRAQRLGPKLRDLVYARPSLEQLVHEFDLFPEKSRRSMLDAVEEMQLNLGFRARASDSFVISFTYEDPGIAQRVTARIADVMIQQYARQNLDSATLTRDFLHKKLKESEDEASAASRALAVFLDQHPQFQWGVNDSPYAPTPAPTLGLPIPFPNGRRPTVPDTIPDRGLGAVERELARVEAELAGGSAGPRPMGPSMALAEARRRDEAALALAAAETALREKLQTFTPAHPDAIAAKAAVNAARQALAAAESALAQAKGGPEAVAPSTREPLSPEHREALQRQRASLRKKLAELRGLEPPAAPPRSSQAEKPSSSSTNPVVELETEWHRLRLELERAREKLHTIQANARSADIAADAVVREGHEEMQILEPAYLPLRPERGRGRVVVIGALISLFLALGYAGARVLANDTVLDEADVNALGAPDVLVSMPCLPEVPEPPPLRAVVPTPRDEDFEVDGWPNPLVTPEPPPTEPSEGNQALVLPRLPPMPLPEALSHDRTLALRAEQVRKITLVEAMLEDPEVEVVGADVEPTPGAISKLITTAPKDVLSALRVLRHRLEQHRKDSSFVLSVMSPSLAEGKTTLALRLALTLSEADRARVILVEGHFEHPRLAAELGIAIPEGAGFSTQLKERMNGHGIAWGVIRLNASLALLGEPGAVAHHLGAIHSTHFQSAIAALRRSYDYVVIDGPSIIGQGDANVIETASDGVLLLVKVGSTQGVDLSRAAQQLGERRILGTILNHVPTSTEARARPSGSRNKSKAASERRVHG